MLKKKYYNTEIIGLFNYKVIYKQIFDHIFSYKIINLYSKLKKLSNLLLSQFYLY